jgi:hypothetical protein
MPGSCAYRCDPTGAFPAPQRIAAHTLIRSAASPMARNSVSGIADVAKQLADMFKHDSREFRYDRFFPACRLGPWGELLPNPVFDNTIGGKRHEKNCGYCVYASHVRSGASARRWRWPGHMLTRLRTYSSWTNTSLSFSTTAMSKVTTTKNYAVDGHHDGRSYLPE